MRLYGLASGFDTEAMVQNLMTVERMKVDRYARKKQTNQWRQQDYNKVNNQIANFILNSKKNVGLNKTSSTGGIQNQSWKSLDYVKKVDSTNEATATAKVIGSAANGRFTVEVEQLAEDATFVTGQGEDVKVLSSDRLEEDLIFKHDGQDIELADAGTSIADAVKAINNNKEMQDRNISAVFDRGTGRIFIQGDASEEGLNFEGLDKFRRNVSVNQKLDFSDDEAVLEKDLVIAGVTVAKEGSKIGDIKAAINSDGDLSKEASDIKEKLDKLKEDSKVDHIGIKDGRLEVFKEIKLFGEGEEGPQSSKGQLAKVKVNGVSLGKQTSNTIEFNGVEINIKDIGTTSIDVSTNTDGIMDKIKGLVDEYNTLLDSLTKKMTEERHFDYHPLSQEEKEAMTEKDIELWEEKAKSGLLKKDETIGRMLSKVRGDLYKNVEGLEGKFKNITEIGITTMKWIEDPIGGKLQIDEDKLRAALEDDAEGVMELLFGEGKKGAESEGNSSIGSTNKGLFTGIYDNLIDGMKDIVNVSGPGDDSALLRSVRSNLLTDFISSKGSISDLDRSIANMDKQIADLEVLLAKKEDSYYAQFTRMEKYIYEMNSQSQWMVNQMM